jgi:hypothetical protein
MKLPDDSLDRRLSYSSASLLLSCSQKYFFYKVRGLPPDSDFKEDDKALMIGKAFHQVLEKSNHVKSAAMGGLLKQACSTFNIEEEQGMIHGMLLKYLECHELSGLRCHKSEFEMSNENFIGYIDGIFVDDKTEEFWIVDLKTASTFSPSITAKLHTNTQLNLYSYFSGEMATQFNLDASKFAGTRYRVTTKTKIKRRAGEEYAKFVARCYESVDSFDCIIPKEIMRPEMAMAQHLRLFVESLKLRDCTSQPVQNFDNCLQYFKPCKYWSQCHGDLYTNCLNKIKILGGGSL